MIEGLQPLDFAGLIENPQELHLFFSSIAATPQSSHISARKQA